MYGPVNNGETFYFEHKKNNISINKVPMTGRTIYITKFPDDNTEQEN